MNAKLADSGMSKVAGYDYEMGVLYAEFIDKIKKEREGSEVEVFGSILFFGPWGNGKTHITEAVAEETGCKVIPIKNAAKNPEAKVKTMQNVLEEAQKAQERFKNDRARTVLFMDEIDKLICEDSPVKKEFEEFIKTCSQKYHCTVFAATNDPLELGVDMKDPSIFPIKMSIDPPNNVNVAEMFKYCLKDYSTEELDYKALAEELLKQGNLRKGQFSNGQILNICDEVYKAGEGEVIKQSDIIEYMQNMQIEPEISNNMGEKFYNDFKTLMVD